MDRPDAKGQGLVVLSDSTDRSQRLTGRWQGPVKHDRMSPVGKIRFWKPYWKRPDAGGSVSGQL